MSDFVCNGWRIFKEYYADGPSLYVWKAVSDTEMREFSRRKDAVAFAMAASPTTFDRMHQLALDVIGMAYSGGMPDTFWHTDARVRRALVVLECTVEQALAWAAENAPRRA